MQNPMVSSSAQQMDNSSTIDTYQHGSHIWFNHTGPFYNSDQARPRRQGLTAHFREAIGCANGFGSIQRRGRLQILYSDGYHILRQLLGRQSPTNHSRRRWQYALGSAGERQCVGDRLADAFRIGNAITTGADIGDFVVDDQGLKGATFRQSISSDDNRCTWELIAERQR